MKVKRYPSGETNVGLLKEGRSNIMTPQFAARMEYAKYDAFSGIAESMGESFAAISEARNASIDADDSVKTERSIAEFTAAKKRLKTQIESDPNATAEDYEEAMGELVRGLTDRGELISERNRKEYMERAGFIGRMALEDVLVESSIMRVEKTREILADGIEASIADADWDAARMQTIMGVEQGLWDERAKDKLLYDIDAREIAEGMGERYKDAVAVGKQDEFMEKVGGMDFNDETLAYFGEEKKKVDLFADQVEAEVRLERSIEYNDYKAKLSSQSDPKTVKAWIRERPWLDDGQINSLYSAMKKSESTGALLTDIYSERDAKKNRELANTELDLTQPPENVAMQASAFAGEHRIVPTAFTNMVNNFAETEEPGNLIQAGAWVMQMEESAPGINMHLHDMPMAKIQMYNDMVRRGVDTVQAATTTTNHFAGITEQVVDARAERYETEGYGPDNLSPRVFIEEEINKRLTDLDTPDGQLFAADLGEGIFNLADQYDDTSVTLSPLMQDSLATLAKNFYVAGASEEVAIQSAIRAIRNQGFGATDINNGVIWAGEEEYEYQIQRNPITRVGGSVIPAAQVRSLIAHDIKGQEFNRINDPLNTKARQFSVNDIVVGDGIEDAKGMKWPLLSNGSQLTLNGQPVYYRYPVQMEKKEKTEAEALGEIESATAASMRAQLTGGKF